MAFTETTERRVPFTTDDGLALNLINITSAAGAQRGPVLLVHGAGVRADIFRPPTERTVVDVLVDEGYDVWLENWRASPEVEPSDWNLDQAARFDHPAAVQTVVNETGADTIKAIIHCQGSTSFMMSSIAGLVPEVDTIISNAVSLHPIVPAFSKFKLRTTLPMVARFIDSVDPAWGDHPPRGIPQLINGIVKLTHHECDVTACKLVSFTYGAGNPALWLHEHLNDEVHDRFIAEVFGPVPMSFFRHMGHCVKAGHLVALEPTGGLLADYAAGPPQTDARFAFFTGWRNRCFLPESQIKSHEWFDRWRPGYHTLTVLPRYSHLDVFVGSDAHRDVFPLMLKELARTGG